MTKAIIYVKMISELIDESQDFVMSENISDKVGEGNTHKLV